MPNATVKLPSKADMDAYAKRLKESKEKKAAKAAEKGAGGGTPGGFAADTSVGRG